WQRILYQPGYEAQIYHRNVISHPTLTPQLSADPMGRVLGGDRHGFVGNGPVNRIDPFGLQGVPEAEPEGEITREIREGLGYTRPNGYRPTPEERFLEQAERAAGEKILRERYPGYQSGDTYLESQPSPAVSRPATPDE